MVDCKRWGCVCMGIILMKYELMLTFKIAECTEQVL